MILSQRGFISQKSPSSLIHWGGECIHSILANEYALLLAVRDRDSFASTERSFRSANLIMVLLGFTSFNVPYVLWVMLWQSHRHTFPGGPHWGDAWGTEERISSWHTDMKMHSGVCPVVPSAQWHCSGSLAWVICHTHFLSPLGSSSPSKSREAEKWALGAGLWLFMKDTEVKMVAMLQEAEAGPRTERLKPGVVEEMAV